MKWIRDKKRQLLALAIAFGVLLVGAGAAYAQSGAQAVVRGTSNQTVYKAGSTVDISGVVNGDIFCAGQTVLIDATVNGDVICAGQTVTINGNVVGSVRAAGQTVMIGAKVSRNLTLGGQDVTLENGSSVGGDATLAARTLNLNGMVSRDLTAAGSQVSLSGKIGRDLSLRASTSFNLIDHAGIGGKVSYTSPSPWQRAGGVSVAGPVDYHKLVQPKHHFMTGWMTGWKVYWLIATTVSSVVLVALFPQLFRRWNRVPEQKLGWALLTGLIALFGMPIAVFIVLATIVAVPLAILLVALWVAGAMVSMPLAEYYIGNRIIPQAHPLLKVLLGVMIVGLLSFIPVLGWLVSLLTYLLGSGTLLWNLGKLYQKPDYSTK